MKIFEMERWMSYVIILSICDGEYSLLNFFELLRYFNFEYFLNCICM